MAGGISVTPELLRTQACVYTDACSQVEEAKLAVDRMNGEMSEQWKGKAFAAYLDQYQELEVHINRFRDLLVDINRQLCDYADIMAERDEQDAGSFGFM